MSQLKLDISIDTNDVIRFVVVLLTIVVLDMIVLGLVTGPMHSSMIAQIQKEPVSYRILPGILAYVLLAASLYYFVLSGSVDKSGKLTPDYVSAVVLGLAIFGTYNLVNLTLYKDYNYGVAMLDTLWGATLFGASTFVVTTLYNEGIPGLPGTSETFGSAAETTAGTTGTTGSSGTASLGIAKAPINPKLIREFVRHY